jgi:hypothetical protein
MLGMGNSIYKETNMGALKDYFDEVENQYYHIVEDENEMKWFFDHIISKPEPWESYMICLSARSKKLTPDEREMYQLGRGEMMRTEIIRSKGGNWNFNIYKQGSYKYNCNKNAMLTKTGLPYPEKCLVCYAYVNPSDELKCVSDTFEFYNKIQQELIESYRKDSKDGIEDHLTKFPKVFEHLRSCHATNLSRRIWRDIDIDLIDELKEDKEKRKEIEENLEFEFTEKFGKSNFVIIETSGGYHCLIRVSSINSNLKTFCEKLNLIGIFFEEIKLTEAGSQFVPLPGTLQYGNLVKIINKEDFNEV